MPSPLENAIAENQNDKAKQLILSSTQEDINSALMKSLRMPNWEMAGILCALKGANQPSRKNIHYALDRALSYDKFDLLKMICNLDDEDNKPHVAAVDKALSVACQIKKWDFVNYIIMECPIRPTQVAIDTALEQVTRCERWREFKAICDLKGDNKPSQAMIHKVLNLSMAFNSLDALKMICSMTENNKPHQDAIDKAFADAYPLEVDKRKWDFITYLFTESPIQPSQHAVNAILQRAAGAGDGKMVQLLCELKGANKPSREHVVTVLRSALRSENVAIFTSLCQLPGDNRPIQSDVDGVLTNALDLKKWQVIGALCTLNQDNQPSQKTVNHLLGKLVLNEQWELVAHLSKMTGNNKPSQQAITEALHKSAIKCKDADLIHLLCNLPTDNKPTQRGIREAFTQATQFINWPVVRYFIALKDDNKPTRRGYTSALLAASSHNQLDIINTLCELSGDDRLSKEDIAQALLCATTAGHVHVLNYLCNLQGPLKPDEDMVGEALFKAVQLNHPYIVRYLCTLDATNKPKASSIEKAMREAARIAKIESLKILIEKGGSQDTINEICTDVGFDWRPAEVLQCICEHSPVKPQQEVVNLVLLKAVEKGSLSVVKYLCGLNTPFKPTQDAINKALKAAILGSFRTQDIAKFLLSAEALNQPDIATVNEVFLTVVEQKQWGYVQFLSKMQGANKPSKAVIDEAFQTVANAGDPYELNNLLKSLGDNKPEVSALKAALEFALLKGQQKIIDCIKHVLSPEIIEEISLEAVKRHNYQMASYLYGHDLHDNRHQDIRNKICAIAIENRHDQLLDRLGYLQPDHHTLRAVLAPEYLKANRAFFDAAHNEYNKKMVAQLLKLAVTDNNLDAVNCICAITDSNKPDQQDLRAALFLANDGPLKNQLFKAQQMLNLHERINELKIYGEQLRQEPESAAQGLRAIILAEDLTRAADDFAQSFFSPERKDVEYFRTAFQETLTEGYTNMGDHRSAWPLLTNILIAATGVGLILIAAKYFTTGSAFFSTTQRQEKVQEIQNFSQQVLNFSV